jgi:hypothetical protein
VTPDDEQESVAHRPAPWEQVEDGVLIGPGQAIDLSNDDLLAFVSPARLHEATRTRAVAGASRQPPASARRGRPAREDQSPGSRGVTER